MGEFILDKFLKTLAYLGEQFGPVDLLDILIVSVMNYYVVKFIRDRRASKLAIGICLILAMLFISNMLDMRAMEFLLSNIVQVGLIALLIIFQPELRSALEKVGGTSFKTLKNTVAPKDKDHSKAKTDGIANICQAVCELSQEYTGALIIIERNTPLGDIIKTGTVINADICVSMLKNIFFNKAPMHDGATIISGNRIHSAGCFLPLSLNDSIINDLGTRHRAGIGMSENSDAVVIIVSEETGVISVAVDGKLKRGYDADTLAAELEGLLMSDNIYKKIKNRKGTKK